MEDRTRSFRLWQGLTVALMILGYSGYYLCRSDLSVAMPLILRDLSRHGMSAAVAKVHMGTVVSASVAAYALGKFLSGALADRMGGRRNFLGGMAGSVLFTLLFTLGGGVPIVSLAWIGNRLVQSMGWVGMVKISSRWFAYSMYGTVMGVLSLSFLFGDAASRGFMGWLIGRGLSWRELFWVAAGVLFAIFLLNALLLKESPKQIGAPEPPSNPENVYGGRGESATPSGLESLLRPLLASPAFWYVCLLSFGFTLVRETFNTWTPTYFTQAVGMTDAQAATQSAYFSLFGGVSVVLAGIAGDRLGAHGRSLLILASLLLTSGALVVLSRAHLFGGAIVPVALIALIGFLMIGPYSYLAGAISLDFGGKLGCSTACGVIDGVGYVGGILSGYTVAGISTRYGWQGAFLALAGVAALSAVAGALYALQQGRLRRA